MTNFFTGAPRHTHIDIAVKSRKTRGAGGQATRTEGFGGETTRKEATYQSFVHRHRN